MAVIARYFLHSPVLHTPPSSLLSSSKISRPQIHASSASHSVEGEGRRRFMEFPFVSTPHRDLMAELVSTMETRLEPHLLPCMLPPDVQYYQNQTNAAHASLHIRSGCKPSLIDFILGSWLHCELPSGGALNITSLSAYLNPTTDAPNFLMELIQSSPTSIILILDLPPRKDLVLHPEYLHTFYEDTQLEGQRQLLDKIPEVQPYFSSSLYIRSVVSPTAILVRIETDSGGRVEEIVRDHVSPVAKEVMRIWLDRCAFGKRQVGESEMSLLERRDQVYKSKTIEIDLGSNLPRLFGQEIADRVLGAVQNVFNASS